MIFKKEKESMELDTNMNSINSNITLKLKIIKL